jgi:hypothetical protein
VSDYDAIPAAEQPQQLFGGAPEILILLIDSSFLSCPEDTVATKGDDKSLGFVLGHCLFFPGEVLR